MINNPYPEELKIIKYTKYIAEIPEQGNHILAQQTENEILVYQAYNQLIADFAIKNQKLGGEHYSYSRMSWIKPGFLWMMSRCGWAEKPNQERVLGLWISKQDFEKILNEAVYSSFQLNKYESKEAWKNDLANKEVRLQWDPDHDIYGRPLERKAIQLGLKGSILKSFGEEMIIRIDDLTDFVKKQKLKIKMKQINELEVPKESVFKPQNNELCNRIGL
jgi:hypothetical protein